MSVETIAVGNNPDPITDVSNSAEAIRKAGWWQMIDKPERWPLDADATTELLNVAGQYDIDAHELRELITRGMIPAPSDGEDGLEFDAADIMAACQALEFRRQFRPSPSFHDFKKHPAQLALEMARADGLVIETIKGTNQEAFDVTHLLRLMIESGNREGREKIAALLKATLEVEHGVFIR